MQPGFALFLALETSSGTPEARETSLLDLVGTVKGKLDPRLSCMQDNDRSTPHRGKWQTPPFDPRFPNQNQTRNCYQNFLDYHRCLKNTSRRGKSMKPCEYYYRVYHSLCPISWVQRWNEQIQEGTFAGRI
ncbi:cytochrome c oxidase subunit 6B2 [Rhynchocyon petersi]